MAISFEVRPNVGADYRAQSKFRTAGIFEAREGGLGLPLGAYRHAGLGYPMQRSSR